jgi:hypothetical protein
VIKLYIKGDKKNATRAAARRGITVRRCKKVRFGTACFASCRQQGKIVRWFGEKTTGPKAGRGYTPGVLTHYSETC